MCPSLLRNPEYRDEVLSRGRVHRLHDGRGCHNGRIHNGTPILDMPRHATHSSAGFVYCNDTDDSALVPASPPRIPADGLRRPRNYASVSRALSWLREMQALRTRSPLRRAPAEQTSIGWALRLEGLRSCAPGSHRATRVRGARARLLPGQRRVSSCRPSLGSCCRPVPETPVSNASVSSSAPRDQFSV